MPIRAPAARGADATGWGLPPVMLTTTSAAENVDATATTAGSSSATRVPTPALTRCHGLAATATGTSLRRWPLAYRRTTSEVTDRSVNRATQHSSTSAAAATTGQTAASPTRAVVMASSVPERGERPMRGSGCPGPPCRAASQSGSSPSGSSSWEVPSCPGHGSWSTGSERGRGETAAAGRRAAPGRRRARRGRRRRSRSCSSRWPAADSPGRRATYGAITLVRPGATTSVGSAAGTDTVAGAPAA